MFQKQANYVIPSSNHHMSRHSNALTKCTESDPSKVQRRCRWGGIPLAGRLVGLRVMDRKFFTKNEKIFPTIVQHWIRGIIFIHMILHRYGQNGTNITKATRARPGWQAHRQDPVLVQRWRLCRGGEGVAGPMTWLLLVDDWTYGER